MERVLAVARGERLATEVPGGTRVARSGGRLTAGGAEVGRGASRYSRPVTSTADESVGQLTRLDADPAVGRVVVPRPTSRPASPSSAPSITADYAGRPPLLVGVLKGAFMFMTDLSRAIELPVEVDFMAVSSYGSATRTSGVVRIVKDLDADLTDRHVLVVEDIVDSGLTLNYLQRYLQARQPASLEVCALLVKEGQQRTALDLRYVGFTIPTDFVVGYGLDVAERFRNLGAIHLYNGDGRRTLRSRR